MIDIGQAIVDAANLHRIESPEVEFIGDDNPEFAAQMADALRHPTNDNHGRRYRLVKMIFEEIRG